MYLLIVQNSIEFNTLEIPNEIILQTTAYQKCNALTPFWPHLVNSYPYIMKDVQVFGI